MSLRKRLVAIVMAAAVAVSLTACGGGGSSASSGPAIPVSLTDFKINPGDIKVPADTSVTLEIKNDGTQPHNFAIPELKVQTDLIPAGESLKVTVKAKKGTYETICEVSGHKDMGMFGKLIAE